MTNALPFPRPVVPFHQMGIKGTFFNSNQDNISCNQVVEFTWYSIHPLLQANAKWDLDIALLYYSLNVNKQEGSLVNPDAPTMPANGDEMVTRSRTVKENTTVLTPLKYDWNACEKTNDEINQLTQFTKDQDPTTDVPR